MDAPTPADVRAKLSELDGLSQKIVVGLFSVMVKDPARVREREWVAEQLAQVTLLTGEFENDSPQASVALVGEYLRGRSDDLLAASVLLFQRVGLDLAPRASAGFTFDDALACAMEYLPPDHGAGESADAGARRDLGEQPLAGLMAARGLTPRDLVAASTEQLTHKMVTRAMKGRRLTANTMGKVQRAWNQATSSAQSSAELFNYEP